ARPSASTTPWSTTGGPVGATRSAASSRRPWSRRARRAERRAMHVFARGYRTMIAAPVQCDVDGIPKGSHFAKVPPAGPLLARFGRRAFPRPGLRPGRHRPAEGLDDHQRPLGIARRRVHRLAQRAPQQGPADPGQGVQQPRPHRPAGAVRRRLRPDLRVLVVDQRQVQAAVRGRRRTAHGFRRLDTIGLWSRHGKAGYVLWKTANSLGNPHQPFGGSWARSDPDRSLAYAPASRSWSRAWRNWYTGPATRSTWRLLASSRNRSRRRGVRPRRRSW